MAARQIAATVRTLLVVLASSGLLLAGSDPFSGTWKLNPEKSRLPWPAPQSLISHIHADATSIKVREELVSDKGQRFTVTLHAQFDGKDYPVSGSPYADAVSYERVDRHTIKGIFKKAGKVAGTETVVVSQDGRTMTATYPSTGPDGKPVTGVGVLDKR